MERNLDSLSATTFDLVVIGGGITGACIARDAALRGLKVAVLEKGDFAHGTTSGSSKLVHGGLRYLVNGELALVRESLRERRIWEEVAPHQVFPLAFLLPTYGWGRRSGWYVSLGLWLYDLLSFDRNRVSDPAKRLPGFRSLGRDEAADLVDGLDPKGLSGAKVYSDCLMPYPERLCLDCLAQAVEHSAAVANYAEVTGFSAEPAPDGGYRLTTAKVTDRVSGESLDVRGHMFANAGGPWADVVLGLAEEGAPPRALVRSKGIHLVTAAKTKDCAAFIQPEGGGHFFVIPWRGHTLFGTTDEAFDGSPDTAHVSEAEIDAFIATINKGLPGLGLNRDEVLYAYQGLRPLIAPQESGDGDTYHLSREAEVVDHAVSERIEGLVSALGGKWTTSRAHAQELVDLVMQKLGRRGRCETARTPLPGGRTGPFEAFVREAEARHADMPAATVAHLASLYGAALDEVIALGREESEGALLRPLSPERPDIGAQVLYAVRREMARTLEDVALRRTGIGTLGAPPVAMVEAIADLMAGELGWSGDERERQIEALNSHYLYA